MAYTTQTFIKQAFLAVSAAALMAATVPAAYAAPQDGRHNAKQSRPNTSHTNRNTRRDNRQARNAETRRDNRQARNAETRRDNRQARRQEVRRENRQARRQEVRRENRQARRQEIRREIRRDRRHDRRVQQRRAQRHYTAPHRRYARSVRHNNYTPYRSNIGISFNFGSGYNQFRWAPTAYSFYRPAYGHYGNYQRRTTCRRVTLEAWRYGHPQLVSVKQCSNPWDGTYIVQGTERLVARRW